MTKRATNEKPRHEDDKLKGITAQLGYPSNFSVNHNIAITATSGLEVKTASKSQHDKTIIVK
jgi:hypothetical protein